MDLQSYLLKHCNSKNWNHAKYPSIKKLVKETMMYSYNEI